MVGSCFVKVERRSPLGQFPSKVANGCGGRDGVGRDGRDGLLQRLARLVQRLALLAATVDRGRMR